MKVGAVSTSRADFGIYLPLLNRLESTSNVDLTVIATGSHVSKTFGHTIDDIRTYPFHIHATKDVIGGKEMNPMSINEIYADVVVEMSRHLHETSYDLLFFLGDRYEMHAAAAAAVPFGIKMAHIHGGEVTVGAFDEKYRHSLTKISDLHFVTCDVHRNRVLQMGVHEDCVVNTGSLSLENLANIEMKAATELESEIELGFKLSETILVTINPETSLQDCGLAMLDETLAALSKAKENVLFTLGNADTKGDKFRERILDWVDRHPGKAKAYDSLGITNYFSAMKHCLFMLGNSSSGIIEAASFDLPVVNIGERQGGRERSENVVDCGATVSQIISAIEKARAMKGKSFENIYYRKNPSELIMDKVMTSQDAPIRYFTDRNFL